MKNEQQEEAKDLYFHSRLSKAEIARKVGVTRKTIVFWSQQGNWDQLRMSARNMPSIVAEKCYYLINHYMDSLLADGHVLMQLPPLSLKDAQAIYLLASTIKKLKNRSTINESMEMFDLFLSGLKRRDHELATKVIPHIEEYMTIRRDVEVTDFLMEEFRKDATLNFPHQEIQEHRADEKDNDELRRDFEAFLKTQPQNEAA